MLVQLALDKCNKLDETDHVVVQDLINENEGSTHKSNNELPDVTDKSSTIPVNKVHNVSECDTLDEIDEVFEQQYDQFYDLDDSLKDPDFDPAKEESDSSSSSGSHKENEQIIGNVIVDHEEVIEAVPLERENKTKAEVDWEKNVNKRLRMEGKPYKGMSKEGGKWGFNKERNGRILTESKCSKRCNRLGMVKQCYQLTENDRQTIFTNFWENMTWEQRKVYINSLVTAVDVTDKTVGENSRRNRSFRYCLRKDDERIPVCKNMFLSTLGIGEKTVYGWIEESSHGIPEKKVKSGK